MGGGGRLRQVCGGQGSYCTDNHQPTRSEGDSAHGSKAAAEDARTSRQVATEALLPHEAPGKTNGPLGFRRSPAASQPPPSRPRIPLAPQLLPALFSACIHWVPPKHSPRQELVMGTVLRDESKRGQGSCSGTPNTPAHLACHHLMPPVRPCALPTPAEPGAVCFSP